MNTTTKVGLGIAALPVSLGVIAAIHEFGCSTAQLRNLETDEIVSTGQKSCNGLAESVRVFADFVKLIIIPPVIFEPKGGGSNYDGLGLVFTIPFYLGLGIALYGLSKDAK